MTPILHQALDVATPLTLERRVVEACIDVSVRPQDVCFSSAFDDSLSVLSPAERRGALAGVTGHVAESVAESVLNQVGWTPVWHFVGPGRHGVDLLMLGPNAKRLFAIEVKGTLRAGHWPSLRRGELGQMGVEWLDKADNPAMSEWGVTSDDLYGAVLLVNFADLAVKVTLTSDFVDWKSVAHRAALKDVDWLDAAG